MLNGSLLLLAILLLSLPLLADEILLRTGVSERRELAFRCLGVYLAAVSWVVLSGWTLHLFGLLVPAVWRGSTLLFLLIGWLALRPASGDRANLWTDLWRAFRNQRIETRTVLGFAFAWALFGTARIYLLPSTNPDSLMQHLPMAATWLQEGRISEFPAFRRLVHVRPIYGHLQTMFFLSFLPDNTFVEMAQILAWSVTFVASYATSRAMGVGRGLSSGAALLVVSTPAALAFSTTNQVDMPALAFAACFFAFLAKMLHGGAPASVWMAGVSFGLFLGTRSQALLIAPGVMLVFGAWLHAESADLRSALRRAMAFSLPVAFLGGPRYLQNWLRFGSFFDLSDAETHAGMTWQNLEWHLREIWPMNFLDRQWSPTGAVNWQHNTAHLGWPLTYLAVPLALAGLVVLWGSWRKVVKSPAPLLFIALTLVTAVGAVWHPPVPVREMRYLISISVPLFAAAAWSLQRVSEGRYRILFASLLLFALLVNGAAWCTGSHLRWTVAGVLTVLACGASVLLVRTSSIEARLRSFFISGAVLVALFHFVLSALQDHRSSWEVMRGMAMLDPKERTESAVFELVSQGPGNTAVEAAVNELVPAGGELLILNETRYVTSYYHLFGDQHERRVRLLVDFESWQDNSLRERAGIEALESRLSGRLDRPLWILRPSESAAELRNRLTEFGCRRVSEIDTWELWRCSSIELHQSDHHSEPHPTREYSLSAGWTCRRYPLHGLDLYEVACQGFAKKPAEGACDDEKQ